MESQSVRAQTNQNPRGIGFDLLETDDAKLFEFAYTWGDLMELEIIRVLDDEVLSMALESAQK
jgi:hypothetical protein